eukprot:4771949-Pyramimonas_sp.AAC.5
MTDSGPEITGSFTVRQATQSLLGDQPERTTILYGWILCMGVLVLHPTGLYHCTTEKPRKPCVCVTAQHQGEGAAMHRYHT